MAVLVTRPHPDDETTAKALRARGFDVLRAPMLRFEPMPFQDDADAAYGAVIVTSANALRAIAPHVADSPLLNLPLLAVGENTASAARDAGFGEVIASKGDAGALRDLVLARAKSKQLKKASPDPLPGGRRPGARPGGRTRRERFYGGDADHLPDGPRAQPAAGRKRRFRGA